MALLPSGVYYKNRAIVDAVLARTKSLERRLALLERSGVMQEAVEAPGGHTIRFVARKKPLLFLQLAKKGLESAGIYDYRIERVRRADGVMEERIRFGAQQTPSFAAMVRYLKARGAWVRRFGFDGEWVVELGLAGARPEVQPAGQARYDVPKEGLWLQVCGARRVRLASLGGVWYPKVYIYDKDLNPISRYVATHPSRYATISLPNGACYIKIADRFTHKNLRRGVRVSVR